MAHLIHKSDAAPEGRTVASLVPPRYQGLPELAVVEEQGFQARLDAIPNSIRFAIPTLLAVLVIGLIWSTVMMRRAELNAPLPIPILKVLDATATGETTITVNTDISQVTRPVTVTVQLLQAGQPLAWADGSTATQQVTANGPLTLRLLRVARWHQPLDRSLSYAVQVAVTGAKPVTTALNVPPSVSGGFYGGAFIPTPTSSPTATSLPTTEPTSSETPSPTATIPPATPTAQPTLAPALPATKTDTVARVSTILADPAIFKVSATTVVTPVLRSDDNQFVLIRQGALAGWVPANTLTLDPSQLAQLHGVKPAADAAKAGPLFAKAASDGNIRWSPSLQTGPIIGHLLDGQTVTVVGKRAAGNWYHVVAPNADGWVASSLLTISPSVKAAAPIIP